ncbi:MAG: MFS transporter, partial [Gammaproteobacteria bacterium]
STGLRDLVLGITLAAFPLAVSIATPLLGIWSDRVGRKKVLATCLLGSFIGLSACAISVYCRSILLLLTGRLLTGITSASQPIAQAATVDISTEKQKPLNLSLVAFAMTIGMAIGPLLGGFLSDSSLVSIFNVTVPFWVASGLSLINLILLNFFFFEKNKKFEQVKHWQPILAYAKTIFANTQVRCLLICFICLELAWSLYFQAVPLQLMQKYHYSSEQLSIFITFLGTMMSFGLIVVFRLAIKLMPLPQMLRNCFILGILSLFACAICSASWWQWVAIIPFTIVIGIGYTAIISLLSSLVDTRVQGWLMGVCTSLMALSWMVTGLLVAWVLPLGTLYTLLITALIFVIGFCCVRYLGSCFLSFPRKRESIAQQVYSNIKGGFPLSRVRK